MAKTLLLVALVGALVLGGFLLGSRGRDARGARAEATSSAAPVGAPATLEPAVEPAAEAARDRAPAAAPADLEREEEPERSAPPAAGPRAKLVVHVRDERGLAQVGLAVRATLGTAEGEHARLSVPTDELGNATFALQPLSAAQASGAELRVALTGLFTPEVALEVPADPWPDAPLELVAPALGAVELRVFGASGEPHLGEPRAVELRLERELAPGAMVWRESARLDTDLEAGVARFAPIGLGLRLTARIGERGVTEPVTTTFDGPRAAGELVRAELRLAPPPPLATLRVLTPARTPLASTQLSVSLVRLLGGGSLADGGPRKTDAEGRLSLPLAPLAEGERQRLVLSHRPAGEAEQRATLELPRERAPGVNDLGDVLLAPLPLLVGGRVLDSAGQGVAEVSVSLESRSEYGGEVSWDTFAWCEVDAEGRFSSYAEAPEAPLRLVLDAATHQPLEPLEFTPGTAGLELVLQPGLALRGRVLVPAGMSPRAIGVVAQGPREADRREVEVQATGEFELTGLAPMTCDVEFQLRPTGERVWLVPGVRVGGESDARLAEVDLRELVRAVRLGVRTASGAPAPGGWVRLLRASEAGQVAFVIEAGAAELLLPATGADVEVNVPGHRLLRLDGLASAREVALEASFRIQCELAPGVALPAGGELQLRLVPAEAGGGAHCSLWRAHEQAGWFSTAFGDAENTFDERRVVELEVQAPGEYDIVFHLVRGSSTGGRLSVTVPASGPNARLTLDESSAGRTFQVEPEPADYARQLGGG